jgi:hypothetical protein
MTLKATISLAVTSACMLLIATSCSISDAHNAPAAKKGHGPPAHAPAHGYRNKQVSGAELIFDSGSGVYVVVGCPNHYYHDGHFYRQTGTIWEMSLKLGSGWSPVSGKLLPPGLAAKVKSKTYGKANGRPRGKHNRPRSGK